MLIYNVAALAKSDAENQRPEPQRIASVEWSRDGLQAVLYLDGTAQALYDFEARCGYCRMDFPNFREERGRHVAKVDPRMVRSGAAALRISALRLISPQEKTDGTP